MCEFASVKLISEMKVRKRCQGEKPAASVVPDLLVRGMYESTFVRTRKMVNYA